MSCDPFEWVCARCGKTYTNPFFTSYPREFWKDNKKRVGEGRVHEGWYAFHERRQVSPINDRLKPGDCMHCIVSDKEADWNLPRDIRVQAIVPDGGTVEVMRRFR